MKTATLKPEEVADRIFWATGTRVPVGLIRQYMERINPEKSASVEDIVGDFLRSRVTQSEPVTEAYRLIKQ